MKLKFPKTIFVASDKFKVKYDKKEGGGSFDFSSGELIIGTHRLKDNPETVFNVICHELMEITCCVTSTRYYDPGTMKDFKFFMTHKEFQTNIEIFSKALDQFLE